jgi:LPXTG-motif cell wall-anchored protein
MTNIRNSRIRNFRFIGTLAKSAVALALVGGLVVGTGAAGASASNGSSKSSDRSHEAHDEHEKDHDGIGHGENDDHKGRGRGHDHHGNGHGYGHGDGCDDHEDHEDHDAPDAQAPSGAGDAPADAVSEAEAPVDQQDRSPQPDAVETNETTVSTLQPAALGDSVNAPAANTAGEPGTTAPAATESGAIESGTTESGAIESGTTESGAIAVIDSLPMTGASVALVGLAIALAVAGLVVLVARRRREPVVS